MRTTNDSDVDELVGLWFALSADGYEADDLYLLKSDAASTSRTFIAQQRFVDHAHRVVVADAGLRIVGFMTARIAGPHHVLETRPLR